MVFEIKCISLLHNLNSDQFALKDINEKGKVKRYKLKV